MFFISVTSHLAGLWSAICEHTKQLMCSMYHVTGQMIRLMIVAPSTFSFQSLYCIFHGEHQYPFGYFCTAGRMTRLQDGSERNQDLFPSRDQHLTQVHSTQTKSEAHPPSTSKGDKRLSTSSWGVQLIIHFYTMLRFEYMNPSSTPQSMWYFRFSKQCCQRFRLSRMWCYITG
jgi:hypothetical protein